MRNSVALVSPTPNPHPWRPEVGPSYKILEGFDAHQHGGLLAERLILRAETSLESVLGAFASAWRRAGEEGSENARGIADRLSVYLTKDGGRHA